MNPNNPNANARHVRLVAVVAVAAFLLWLIVLNFRDPRTRLIDFSHFYCAGQILRAGQGHQLYDLRTQAAFLGALGPVTVFYNHPPFEALIYIPLTYASFHTAYVIWTLLGVALLLAAALVIDRTSQISAALSQLTRIPLDVGLVFIVFLTFSPTTTCLLLGQDSTLMLLVYAATFLLLKSGRDFQAGCTLAIGLFKFNLVLPLALILLLCKKWRVLKGFALVGAGLVIVSIAISGVRALVSYPKFLLFDSFYKQIGGFAPEYMPNLRGMLYLATGGRMPSRWFGALVTAASLLVIWVAARFWRDDRLEASFAGAVLATLLTSYHLYNYDLTLALLPISLIVTSCGDAVTRSKMLPACLVVLFTPPLHRLLLLYEVYALMGIAVAGLFISTRQMASS
jgi:hypothetical protein